MTAVYLSMYSPHPATSSAFFRSNRFPSRHSRDTLLSLQEGVMEVARAMARMMRLKVKGGTGKGRGGVELWTEW